MAWRSSGSSNEALIENMWHNQLLTTPIVKTAFLAVDRAHYAPADPYQDSPQTIGHGATISAPHMHANAVESLLPFLLPTAGPDAEISEHGKSTSQSSGIGIGGTENADGIRGRPRRVLDIGSGSGYLTHVLAELVGETGVVVGVEHIKQLKELGENNMAKSETGRKYLETGRARFRMGDGRKGWVEPKSDNKPGVGGPAEESPIEAGGDHNEDGGWDAIHVGAAAKELHPDLVQQLRSPGRMFIPVEDEDGDNQYIWTVDKDHEGNVTKKKQYGVRYVPLTDAPK